MLSRTLFLLLPALVTTVAQLLPPIFPHGCYTEAFHTRALSGHTVPPSPNNTVLTCATACTALNYPLFGLEYGTECYCGTALSPGSFPAFGPSDCSMPCPGLTLVPETCGGPSRLSLWSTSPVAPPTTPFPPPIPATGQSRPYLTGCITEPAGARALSGRSTASPGAMTLAGCGAFCFGSGFRFYGTEYGSECWRLELVDTVEEMEHFMFCECTTGLKPTEFSNGIWFWSS
ncbi:WSC domain-containing protein [Schizothecium vesticola]|uniref:WSC domain-containing protein n=1 Tax=Schizothecium vesticola TaxID=314040 RepID=A0AA40KBN3_9PEZI|nr:WSC domain-containing protein [Schizothecium vesticola]